MRYARLVTDRPDCFSPVDYTPLYTPNVPVPVRRIGYDTRFHGIAANDNRTGAGLLRGLIAVIMVFALPFLLRLVFVGE